MCALRVAWQPENNLAVGIGPDFSTLDGERQQLVFGNIRAFDVLQDFRIERLDGPYDADDCVFQALAPLPRFGDDHVSVGSWIVNGEPAGIGLREDESAITRNTSRFVPHYFT